MKVIKVNENSQQLIAQQLIAAPEGVCPEKVEFNVLDSSIVEVIIKGYQTGAWHGKVETSFLMNLSDLQKKIGDHITIEK